MPLDSLADAKKHFSHLNEVLASLPNRELNKKEKFLFSKTLDLAKTSLHPRAKIGCLLIEKNTVIASGINERKTHPKVAQFKPFALTLCAEMSALFSLKTEFESDKTIAIVGRVNSRNQLAISYPCMGCLSALSHKNITKIICCGWQGEPIFIDFG